MLVLQWWGMRGIWSLNDAALPSLRSKYAGLFKGSSDTMRSLLAQPDHMGVNCILDCLDLMKI